MHKHTAQRTNLGWCGLFETSKLFPNALPTQHISNKATPLNPSQMVQQPGTNIQTNEPVEAILLQTTRKGKRTILPVEGCSPEACWSTTTSYIPNGDGTDRKSSVCQWLTRNHSCQASCLSLSHSPHCFHISLHRTQLAELLPSPFVRPTASGCSHTVPGARSQLSSSSSALVTQRAACGLWLEPCMVLVLFPLSQMSNVRPL